MAVFLCDSTIVEQLRRYLPEDTVWELCDLTGEAQRESLPGGILAAFAAQGRGALLKAHLGELWGGALIEVDFEAPAEALAALSRVILQNMSHVLRDAGELRRSNAMMRREAVVTNQRLRDIEHVFYAMGNPQYLRALEWQPQNATLSLANGETVVQPLPLDCVSIVAIDLWVGDLPVGFEAELQVLLRTEAGVVWPLRMAQAGWQDASGWRRYESEASVSGLSQNAVLEITWGGETPLALGLSLAVPDTRFSARKAEDAPLHRALALQVWKAQGGAALPAPSRQWMPSLVQPQQQVWTRSASQLNKPQLFHVPALVASSVTTSASNPVKDYSATDFWYNEDAHFVHPSAGGMVCAIVRDVDVPEGFSYASALVNVGHAQSGPLNFALGVAPAGDIDGDGQWQRHLGPWVTALPAEGWGQVMVALPQPIAKRGKVDLLLAVSAAYQGKVERAWGLFRSYRFVGLQ